LTANALSSTSQELVSHQLREFVQELSKPFVNELGEGSGSPQEAARIASDGRGGAGEGKAPANFGRVSGARMAPMAA
jgi:hypothetical protein